MQRHLSGLWLLLTFSAAIFGQPGSGVVRGVVTDESGALVPGAKVTVSNAGRTRQIGHGGGRRQLFCYGHSAGKIRGTGVVSGIGASPARHSGCQRRGAAGHPESAIARGGRKAGSDGAGESGANGKRGSIPKCRRIDFARRGFRRAIRRSRRSAGRFASAGWSGSRS